MGSNMNPKGHLAKAGAAHCGLGALRVWLLTGSAFMQQVVSLRGGEDPPGGGRDVKVQLIAVISPPFQGNSYLGGAENLVLICRLHKLKQPKTNTALSHS